MQSELYIIAAIALGSIVAPLGAACAFGEEAPTVSDETQRLSALFADLKAFGYTEVADYNAEGTLVEFRSNGTIFLDEETLGNLITEHGFYFVENAPAPVGEDSIIIIGTTATAGESY